MKGKFDSFHSFKIFTSLSTRLHIVRLKSFDEEMSKGFTNVNENKVILCFIKV